MKVNNTLLHQCNFFYKVAGVFQAPPAMVDDLSVKAIKIFASAVLYYLSNPENNEKKLLKKEVEKISTKSLSPVGEIRQLLPVNLDGWKYLTPPIMQKLENMRAEGRFKETLKCTYSFSYHGEFGTYNYKTKELIIYLNNPKMITSIEQFNMFIKNIKESVRHELQHFAQFLLSDLLNKKYDNLVGKERGDLAGLPSSKYRTTEADLYGNILDDRTINYPHEFRDVEFYTNLQDSIDSFLFKAKSIQVPYRKNLARAWVGLRDKFLDSEISRIELSNLSNEEKEKKLTEAISSSRPDIFFNNLKKYAPDKWELAVKIFYKKVSYLW